MIKIVWSINDINKYQTGSLPDDAVKIETPQSVGDLMKKAVPIAAILCVFLFIAMLCKTIICKTVVISPIFILVGFTFGFLLLIIHEWLHGIVYPKEADVTIGRNKRKDNICRISILSIEAKSIYIDVPVAICSWISSIYIICN